ncbi:GNAT family N-acetyltransferase [Streptomyces sp. NPDC056160]|uniref:GNAT family N-acetyltransferase n=1 Tax=Streptomyces sp. NPDC056160 TaxID=3345731 RepID=UPI0035E18AC6
MDIRSPRVSELPVLQDIERAAGQLYHDIGMPEIAGDEPLTADELARYQRDGRAWVAVDAADAAVAYLIADRVDGNFHVEQVSVHPGSARRGVGRSLLEHLADHARSRRAPVAAAAQKCAKQPGRFAGVAAPRRRRSAPVRRRAPTASAAVAQVDARSGSRR